MPLSASEKAKLYRAKNPDKASADAKAWRIKNPGVAARTSAAYYEANRDSEKKRTGEYRRANLGKYRELERNNNASKVAKNAERRARKASANPIWLTKEQRETMREFYRACPDGHEVDHIIPLCNPAVCGLHVPWNLQHLTIKANRAKGNRFS